MPRRRPTIAQREVHPARQLEMASGGGDGRTLADVAAQDVAWREAAASAGVVPLEEAKSLRGLMACSTSGGVCERCKATVGPRWTAAQEAWSRAEKLPDEQLGTAVEAVVQDLDAAHLLPSSIAERLRGGVDAACHGLATLLANIKA